VSQPVIQTVDLTKSYGKFRGIEGINLSVDAGEIFGFIGPNGAGKSTTIRTLLALIRPTSGTAMIFGKDCVKEASKIAKDVAYLPSEPSYYETMKVKEFLSYAAALYGVKADKRIKELAERLNLDLFRKISDLSLGNKKKVGIVSCLLHAPKLMILDEPTAGLDPLMQQEFFDILLEENKKGATIFFSSHVLSEVQKICGRVVILKEGKVLMLQKISELRKNGYKKIRLTALGELPERSFDFPGVASLKQEGANASFMFMGDVSEILKKASSMPLADIFIEEPTLEEIFLNYYK
jgi:ABC-2 type transport system ATP-binding protein